MVNSSTLEPSAFTIFVVGSPFAFVSIVVVVSTTRFPPAPVEISVTSLPVVASVMVVSVLPVTLFTNDSVMSLVVPSTERVPVPITLVWKSPDVSKVFSEIVMVAPSVTVIVSVPSKFEIVSVFTPVAMLFTTLTSVPSFCVIMLSERISTPDVFVADFVTWPSTAVTVVSIAPVATPPASTAFRATVTTWVSGSTVLVPVDATTVTAPTVS